MKALVFTSDAAKDLRRHGNMAKRLREAIEEYAANPNARANNVTTLKGSTAKRLRVGDYRIIFEETETDITVVEVGPRGDVYDG